ncbi:nucleoside-diphosphate sugar epimerase [Lysinibacillus yapensis]|uniref:Nucleoside-diphosphate sugar epimerase n=1 Tax=Ureibacillus yapensis TaxID=2304605 RepID=A0A396S4G1_9BACL|nr:nucleoside-diphosphate sugar epimerase [Lysinibacillus yapensis]
MLRLSWLISLGISLLGFLIIGQFFTIQPEDTLENTNLGFIGIILVCPFLFLSLFTTFRFFFILAGMAKNRLLKVLSFVLGLLLIGVLFYFIMDYKNGIILDGPTMELNSTFYNLPMLNEFTYTIFFNFYTFAFIHSISGLMGGIFSVLKNKKRNPSEFKLFKMDVGTLVPNHSPRPKGRHFHYGKYASSRKNAH